jgi:hypothetical protein
MRKTWVYAIAILMFLTISIIPSPSTEAGPLVTSVSTDADPYVEVDVSPGSPGSVTIYGNVTCQTTNPLTPVIVTLAVSSTVGVATIDKPSMEFQGTHQTEEFLVVITPLGETASTDYSCIVSGTWQQGGQTGDVDPSTTQVVVLPFSLCNIINTEIEKTAETGDSVSFTIELENQGNCDDVYNIEITNLDDLESKGITVDEIGDVGVLQGDTEMVFIKVHISSDCKASTCRVDLTITGTAEEDSEEFRVQLDARIEEGHIRSNNPIGAFIVFSIIVAILMGLFLFARRTRKKKKTSMPPSQ